jgi:phytoene dehydrogenase-like protein
VLACRSSLVIRKTGKQAAFRKAIEAQFALLSHLERRASSFPVSAAYLFSLPARGIFYPVGGRSAWMAWLRQGFVTAGGTLIDDCSVMRIDTKPEIVVDIERSGEPLSLRARRLGLSTQWEKLNLLLLQQKFFRRLLRRLNGIRTHAYPFCLHMGVHEGGLPERLAPYCVVVPDERKEARRPGPVFLKTSLHGETDLAPAGRRTLSATVYLKDSPLVLADIQLKEVAKSIMDSLEEFLPFLRDSIDYIHVERSIALSRQYQEAISHQYQAPKRAWLALNTLSPATPLPDVFLTGGILRAGLGFEGEVLSGLDAALWAGRKEQSNG